MALHVLPPPPDDAAEEDLLKQARDTVALIMRGEGGRGAMTRLMAAQAILSKDYLSHLSDEDLLAEVRRRAAAAKRRPPAAPPASEPPEGTP